MLAKKSCVIAKHCKIISTILGRRRGSPVQRQPEGLQTDCPALGLRLRRCQLLEPRVRLLAQAPRGYGGPQGGRQGRPIFLQLGHQPGHGAAL